MGSKVISSSGNNSIDKVRFMISPDLTGKMEYSSSGKCHSR